MSMDSIKHRSALIELYKHAAELGLEIHGWILSTNAPLVQIEGDGFTCPHCKAHSAELLIIEDGARTSTAYAEDGTWCAVDSDFDFETVGYQCSLCYGAVAPAEDVEW